MKGVFSNKDFGKAAYILSIKIYRDRSRRLISFSNEYIPWQDFEVVQNGTVKERVLACVAKVWNWVRLKSRPRQKIEKNESHSLCISHRFYKSMPCYGPDLLYTLPWFGKGVQ